MLELRASGFGTSRSLKPPSQRARLGQGMLRPGYGEQMAGGEEAFAEVAGDDFFRVADGG